MKIRISKFKVILGISAVACAISLNAQDKLHEHAHVGHDDGIESKDEHLRWESQTAHSLLKGIVEMNAQFQRDLDSGEIHAIHLKLEDFVEFAEHLPELSEKLLKDEELLRVFQAGNSLDKTIVKLDDAIHKQKKSEIQKYVSQLSQLVTELKSHYPKELHREIEDYEDKKHTDRKHVH